MHEFVIFDFPRGGIAQRLGLEEQSFQFVMIVSLRWLIWMVEMSIMWVTPFCIKDMGRTLQKVHFGFDLRVHKSKICCEEV